MNIRLEKSSFFFIRMAQVFVAVAWVVTISDAALRPWQTAVPLTLLFLLHGALHSLLARLATPVHALLYVAGQNVLLIALAALSGGNDLVLALYFPLMGEALGLFPNSRWRAPVMGALVLVWVVTMLAMIPRPALAMRVPALLLSLVFVVGYVQLFLRQTEDRQRAEALAKQLEQANVLLRSYAVKVEELSITQERQRMARELHDTLAQGLAGLIMQLEAVDGLLEQGDTNRARAINGRAMERARSALTEARLSIQALRSPLGQGELIEGIRRQMEHLQEDTGIAFTLEAGPGDLEVNEATRLQLFRVIQEGLANIARHSQAKHARVRLQSDGHEIHLEVVDDGVGFDPSLPPEPGHYGITGLRERIELASGQLWVESSPGRGTRLLVTLPEVPPPLEE